MGWGVLMGLLLAGSFSGGSGAYDSHRPRVEVYKGNEIVMLKIGHPSSSLYDEVSATMYESMSGARSVHRECSVCGADAVLMGMGRIHVVTQPAYRMVWPTLCASHVERLRKPNASEYEYWDDHQYHEVVPRSSGRGYCCAWWTQPRYGTKTVSVWLCDANHVSGRIVQ